MKKPVGSASARRTHDRRYRTRGGNWSFVVARAIMPQNADPATFTHDEIAQIIQAIERTDLNVNVTAIRYDLEWLIWDRDGWRHVDRDKHEPAA